MIRRIIFAVALALSFWTFAQRCDPAVETQPARAAALFCATGATESSGGTSDQHWHAGHQRVATLTESCWNAGGLAVTSTAATAAILLTDGRPASVAPLPQPYAPAHLRHTPLLI